MYKPSDPEGRWFEAPRHTGRCIEDVGNRQERFLSLILRPSSLINRYGNEVSASGVVKQVLTLQCWSTVKKTLQEQR